MLKKIMKRIIPKSKNVYVNVGELKNNQILEDKVIMVTGGGSGIGESIARTFAIQGGRVLIIGRSIEKLKNVADSINKECMTNASKGSVDCMQWDVSDIQHIEDKFRECIVKIGKIDILVNNAGVFPGEIDLLNTSIDQFEITFRTNLEAPYFLTSHAIKYMTINNIEGNIIFIASETADVATTNPYGLSKTALVNLAKGVAFGKKEHGVRCNVISPGITVSNINKRDLNGDLSAGTINGRLLRPEEIAQTALFLASDSSKCINGEVIRCNEGNTINVEYFRK